MKKSRLIVALTLVVWCASFAYGKDDTEVKGLITGRTADSMTVRTADGTSNTVVLTDDTKVQMPKGLGIRKTQVSWTELIPGLRVTVKGNTDTRGQIVASKVSFSKDDLRTANMIQAGLDPTKSQVQTNEQNIAANKENIAANQQKITASEQETNKRFAELADYDVKGDAKVYFDTGKSTLSAKGKASLSQLAANAKKNQGYLIQVKGFADSTGNPAMNQTLSKDRAEAVINYLMQACNVSPRHIVAPGAMGIADPVASNETAQGREENRRVEVTVLVNKGLAGENAAK